MKKVLVVGSGAREHALAWRIARDGKESGEDVDLLCAPGNGGTAALGRNVAVAADDVEALETLAVEERVDLVVVGPEAPLVAGLVDRLEARKIAAFGPRRAAAELEGSKVFAKRFMQRCGVPTAGFRVFSDADDAERYVRTAGRPLVVKADGLAAGKGVVVAADADEAVRAIQQIMRERAFGAAGAQVVVEECLAGPEVSYHVVADGERYVALAACQDHKRIGEGDTGLNTGGMGAYSPPPMVTPDVEQAILRDVVEPTLAGLREDDRPFRGALFVGLMIVDGRPQVLEYNVRFGDPECEALVMRWQGPLLPLLAGAAQGDLAGVEPRWEAPASLSVVLASGGYPGAYEKGKPIRGLAELEGMARVQAFHAGTAVALSGSPASGIAGAAVVTSGGRVLTVTATGDSVDDAAKRAYAAAELVEFEGKYLRRDIGWQARQRPWSLAP